MPSLKSKVTFAMRSLNTRAEEMGKTLTTINMIPVGDWFCQLVHSHEYVFLRVARRSWYVKDEHVRATDISLVMWYEDEIEHFEGDANINYEKTGMFHGNEACFRVANYREGMIMAIAAAENLPYDEVTLMEDERQKDGKQ